VKLSARPRWVRVFSIADPFDRGCFRCQVLAIKFTDLEQSDFV
jgi:hypothetical protein